MTEYAGNPFLELETVPYEVGGAENLRKDAE